jgi:hypothetical protein
MIELNQKDLTSTPVLPISSEEIIKTASSSRLLLDGELNWGEARKSNRTRRCRRQVNDPSADEWATI